VGGTIEMKKELEKALEARNLDTHKRSFKQEKFRAQSIMVGKVGHGTTEIALRGLAGDYLFIVLHPAEVVELMHQIAANTGCTIKVAPREDFASYRKWSSPTEGGNGESSGIAPHPEIIAGFQNKGV
jgi:hypothetical protein